LPVISVDFGKRSPFTGLFQLAPVLAPPVLRWMPSTGRLIERTGHGEDAMTQLFVTTSATVVVGAALAVAALATEERQDLDANGDGLLSFAELLLAYPALTAAVYGTMDTNDDGAVDSAELKAAQNAGLIVSEG